MQCLLLGILQAVGSSNVITTKNRPLTDSRAQASLCNVFSENPQMLAQLWEVLYPMLLNIKVFSGLEEHSFTGRVSGILLRGSNSKCSANKL